MAHEIESSSRLDDYLERLFVALRHADRHAPMRKYCAGLLLEGTGKSVEPMAARLSPARVSAEHQSLLHFVGKSPWSDEAVLRAVRDYALPRIEEIGPIAATIFDDTGLPKKGTCSVGVANQYCGVLGKNHNCQVSVTISLANEMASLPVAHRLYLPKSWTDDATRCERAGVPEGTAFKRKWELALDLLDKLRTESPDLPKGVAVADAGYGDCFDFRAGLTERSYEYAVGVSKSLTVWAPGTEPQPVPYGGIGRPPEGLRRTKDNAPMSARDIALGLADDTWHEIGWREGSKGRKSGRFAAVRVRPARRIGRGEALLPEEWLLMEWPHKEAEPTKYWLSTLPDDTTWARLVQTAKLRWRIERDYQDLKQEVGFSDYQGRGWRGYHHHLTLAIAAYAFLTVERARLFPPGTPSSPTLRVPRLPASFRPRGAPDPR